MTFFAYIGIGFAILVTTSITVGLVRGLRARRQIKKALNQLKGDLK